MRTILLKNGIEILANVFGKEISDYQEDVNIQRSTKRKEYNKIYARAYRKRQRELKIAARY
jgi:restriction endonuclease